VADGSTVIVCLTGREVAAVRVLFPDAIVVYGIEPSALVGRRPAVWLLVGEATRPPGWLFDELWIRTQCGTNGKIYALLPDGSRQEVTRG
jgi:hypothetical protein